MENVIEITPEGLEELKEELVRREGPLAQEIIERIKNARSFGDLSENSEFDDAKDEQAQNEARIRELRHIIANAKVSESIRNVASMGNMVTVVDEHGEVTTFKIVGTTSTNSLEYKISNESPLGKALIGHRVGDIVYYLTPSGKKRTFTIEAIAQPKED